MLPIYWAFAFSFSIFIAGIIALIRFNKINKCYYPFLYCIWIACVNELLSFILFKNNSSTSINSNLYVLIESLLIIWLFQRLKRFNKQNYLFLIIAISFLIIWCIENFVVEKITGIAMYFRIYYSLIIVLLSINYLNQMLGSAKEINWKNSDLLLCLGFILFFTYKLLVQSFWLYGLKSSKNFLLTVYPIMVYINLVSNLIYAIAVLWMPRKLVYTQQY